MLHYLKIFGFPKISGLKVKVQCHSTVTRICPCSKECTTLWSLVVLGLVHFGARVCSLWSPEFLCGARACSFWSMGLFFVRPGIFLWCSGLFILEHGLVLCGARNFLWCPGLFFLHYNTCITHIVTCTFCPTSTALAFHFEVICTVKQLMECEFDVFGEGTIFYKLCSSPLAF